MPVEWVSKLYHPQSKNFNSLEQDLNCHPCGMSFNFRFLKLSPSISDDNYEEDWKDFKVTHKVREISLFGWLSR